MTQGFLLFAHDNESISYGLMAYWQAKRIEKHLAKPVSIVTDSNTVQNLDQTIIDWRKTFDKVILVEELATQTKIYIDTELTFHNIDRVNAWDSTPYDETIVIDTDIIIQSNKFNHLWNYNADLVVCKNSPNLHGECSSEFRWISEKTLPFYWATAFYFKKTEESKLFFDHCKYVKKYYGWFKHVYDLNSGPVRNDFIWSIALHNLSGRENFEWAPTIPWTLHHSENKDHILKMTECETRFLTPKGLCLVKNQDVHVLNKFTLLDKIKEELGVEQ
jgi:hypothetical protein